MLSTSRIMGACKGLRARRDGRKAKHSGHGRVRVRISFSKIASGVVWQCAIWVSKKIDQLCVAQTLSRAGRSMRSKQNWLRLSRKPQEAHSTHHDRENMPRPLHAWPRGIGSSMMPREPPVAAKTPPHSNGRGFLPGEIGRRLVRPAEENAITPQRRPALRRLCR